MSKAREYTIVAAGDMHCGQASGLTPPNWQQAGKRGQNQRNSWNWFKREVKKIGHIDAVLGMGDLIDGKGEASGGIELITADSFDQCEMAYDCMKVFNADNYHIVEGTAYHSGKKDTMEKIVAKELGAEFEERAFPRYGGVQFDLRHHIGSSSVPWGRHTACAKEYHMALAWHYQRRAIYPKPNIVLRGHVHYHTFEGGLDENGQYWMGATTPALQTLGTKYGKTKCSGLVDFGFLVFKIKGGQWSMNPHTTILETMKCHPTGPKKRKAKQ